jgi:hypothetical protein
MHAWLCETPTGADSLRWAEQPTPQPRAGEALIAVHAASLNFPDLLTVQNKYQIKPPLPFVPGSGSTVAALAQACVPKPPVTPIEATASPTLTWRTPSPTACTTPENSLPGTNGSGGLI